MSGELIACLILRFSLKRLTSWQRELHEVDVPIGVEEPKGEGGRGTITRCNTGLTGVNA